MHQRWMVCSCFAFLALMAGGAPAARAGDITVFATRNHPTEQWGNGYGAALSSTWFRIATFEAEVARVPGDVGEAGMTSFTGSALLSVPIGVLTPYGGLGVGFFRETTADDSDVGSLKAFVLGAKLHLGGLIVVRGDYRRYSLSGPPLVPMDYRLAAGVGVAF